MPHMRVAGGRLMVASDDFVLTSCLSLVARLIGLVYLVIVSVVYGDLVFGSETSAACANLGKYTLASLVIFGVLLVHSVTMCRAAGAGGVLQPSARSRVAHVLVFGMLVRAVEVVCAIYGVLQLREVDFGPENYRNASEDGSSAQALAVVCDEDVEEMLRSVNIIQWALLSVGICCSCAFYHRSRPKKNQNKSEDTGFEQRNVDQMELMKKLTSFRQCCSCDVCKDVTDDVFRVVAQELHQYFSGWDVVVTDIIVGLVLVGQLQAEARTQVQLETGEGLPTEMNIDSEHLKQRQALLDSPPAEVRAVEAKRQKTAEADSVVAALDDVQEHDVDVYVTPEWAQDTNAQLSTLEEGLKRHITNHVLSKHVTFYRMPVLAAGLQVQADLDSVRDLQYFLRFALGAYGWLLHAFRHAHKGLICAPCALCKLSPCVQAGCSCFCTPRNLGVRGDNCCRCNQTAVSKTFSEFWSPADQPELVYMSLHNRVEFPAYNICVDKVRRKVVIAIRGTLSVQDCMTDCVADDESLDGLGLEGEFAHDGMYKSAWNIKEDLTKRNLLSALLIDGQIPADHPKCVDPASEDCRGYDLVVCGHSLGGGTAAILAMMLRPQWPGIHCYAFSPPGGLLSENAAISTREYITSVILGDDFIGRLSMRSMELLKDEMIECLSHCKVPKYKIVAGAALASCGQRPTSAIVDEPDLAHVGTEKGIHADDNHIRQLEKHRASRMKNGTLWLADRKMLPPGNVLFLRRLGPHGHHRLEPEWAANDEFQRIAVSSHMLTDHLPNHLQDALDEIAQTMGISSRP